MADENLNQLKSVEERDQEWLDNVYRGDKEKDLTVRAVVAGMAFGGLMSISNLYVGLKSGWGLGVDIAAVVVIFTIFKVLRGIGLVKREFGLLENTMMMTVAVAASWISSAGLVSAVPALTMLTGYTFIWWQLSLFIAVVLLLGLFMAIPLKRQMIQIDALKFPGNIPTGETLKAMYAHGEEGMKKAKAMGIAGFLGVALAALRDFFGVIPSMLNLPGQIGRIGLGKLTLSFEPSLIFIGIGAVFGIKIGISMLLGLILNYGILAPNLINHKNGDIKHAAPEIKAAAAPQFPLTVAAGDTFAMVLTEATSTPELTPDAPAKTVVYSWTKPTTYNSIAEIRSDLSAPTLQDGSENPFAKVIAVGSVTNKQTQVVMLTLAAPAAINWEAKLSIPTNQSAQLVGGLGFKPDASAKQAIGGFRNIAAWSLWPGATVMVVGGLLALAFQWRTMGRTFADIFASFGKNRHKPVGVLAHLEIPMTWFIIGFVLVGILAMLLMVWMFSIHWWMGLIAVILTFFLAAVAARASAETSVNPIGAMGKVTQLTYGVVAPGNIPANLMTAGVTAGAACSCSDTIGNLKVGHMVGANPRKQFIAQVFGVLAGSLLAVPVYFLLVPDPNALGGEKFPAPSALIWKGVAQALSQGLHTLPHSALVAVLIALIVGVVIVVVERIYPKARPYMPSPTALGIAMTIPASTSFLMFLGAIISWILEKKAPNWSEKYVIAIASGCIAGESIAGVAILGINMALGR
jgi:uncharacterized oligopeptide transporter (OPT) family protein